MASSLALVLAHPRPNQLEQWMVEIGQGPPIAQRIVPSDKQLNLNTITYTTVNTYVELEIVNDGNELREVDHGRRAG